MPSLRVWQKLFGCEGKMPSLRVWPKAGAGGVQFDALSRAGQVLPMHGTVWKP